jgi:sulfhydrogenase subunit alpha
VNSRAPTPRNPAGPEPPRALEAVLRGRAFAEPPEILARIGGHDRAAHQVCACHAIEAACHARIPEPIEALRRLLCCAAWIEGHAAHIHLVQAPRLLGCADATGLARRHRAEVLRGQALGRVGAELAEAIGGGAFGPPTLRIGGFRSVPNRVRLAVLGSRMDDALDAALETVRWISGFDFPQSVLDVPLLALDDPERGPTAHGEARYPLDGGSGVLTTSGLGFPLADFESYISRPRTGRPESSRAMLRGSKAALTGPMARFALAAPAMNPAARTAARAAGLDRAERNPYRAVLIRAVELVHALEEARGLIERYEPPNPPHVAVHSRAGRGLAAVEAPSGLLYQRYDLLPNDKIGRVRLIGAGELNRAAAELDLRRAVREATRRDPTIDEAGLAALRARLSENYEPCIPRLDAAGLGP